MFEERSISVLTYNLETLLAEKFQTILVRGIANTRMRDYYDVYELLHTNYGDLDIDLFKKAFFVTCKKRDSVFTKDELNDSIQAICADSIMKENWDRFREKNYFVGNLEWSIVMDYVVGEIKRIFIDEPRK